MINSSIPVDEGIREGMLGQVIAFSQKMLAAAEQHEWTELADMSVKRQEMLERLFKNGPFEDIAEKMHDGLRKIMDIDEHIIKLGSASRNEVVRQLNQISTSQHAVKAYVVNSVK